MNMEYIFIYLLYFVGYTLWHSGIILAHQCSGSLLMVLKESYGIWVTNPCQLLADKCLIHCTFPQAPYLISFFIFWGVHTLKCTLLALYSEVTVVGLGKHIRSWGWNLVGPGWLYVRQLSYLLLSLYPTSYLISFINIWYFFPYRSQIYLVLFFKLFIF